MLLSYEKMKTGRYLLQGWALVTVIYLLTPVVFIVVLSFGSSRWLIFPPPGWTTRWYSELFANASWADALVNSAQIGVGVTALSMALALPAAFGLVRSNFPGKSILNAIFTIPIIVPLVIVGVAMYAAVLRVGMDGTKISFIIAHTIISLPIPILLITNALRDFDVSVEDAAVICGASRLNAIWRVTMPAIAPSLVAAALFAFLISWDEVVVAIFMSSASLQTLPVQMWTMMSTDVTPQVAAAASVMIVSTITIMGLVGLVIRLGGRARRLDS